MAFRRFRRKNNGLWFPTFQPDSVNAIAVNTNTEPAWDWSQIIPGDAPANLSSDYGNVIAPGGLVLALGVDYLIQRIVGKVHVGLLQQGSEATDVASCAVKCGIIVDRVQEGGVFQNQSAWNMFEEASSQKRWLWRRSWVFSNGNFVNIVDWPHANSEYGSVLDGPHVDVKVKARVTYEERLFFGIHTSPINYTYHADNSKTGEVQWMTDFRVLAKRINKNNR